MVVMSQSPFSFAGRIKNSLYKKAMKKIRDVTRRGITSLEGRPWRRVYIAINAF